MDDLEELELEVRELDEEELHRLENEPHRYYTPIGKTGEFIDKFGSDEYITLALIAANGVGKTLTGANILANLFWPQENPYFQSKLFKDWPYSKQGRIVSEPNTIIETIIPTLKATFPKGRYGAEKFSTTKEGKRFESFWETDTGFNFTLMTYEQAKEEFESANLGWFWEDEPPPKDIHDANVARLRNGGVGMITATPLSGSAYLHNMFVSLPAEDRARLKRATVHATLEDACIEHGVRGFIPHEKVVLITDQYDPDERPARASGIFQHLSGLVFKRFSRDIHVIKPFEINTRDFVVARALDPHPRTADAALWVAKSRDNKWYVIDELSGNFEQVAELARRIKTTSEPYRMEKSLIDPSAFIVDQHTRESTYELLRTAGLYFEAGSKQRSLAIQMIKEALAYQQVVDHLVVPPQLYIFDTCHIIISQIENWQWENWNSSTAQNRDPKERPMDKDDHMIENLGRILLSGLEFEEETFGDGSSFSPLDNQREVDSNDPYGSSGGSGPESLDPY